MVCSGCTLPLCSVIGSCFLSSSSVPLSSSFLSSSPVFPWLIFALYPPPVPLLLKSQCNGLCCALVPGFPRNKLSWSHTKDPCLFSCLSPRQFTSKEPFLSKQLAAAWLYHYPDLQWSGVAILGTVQEGASQWSSKALCQHSRWIHSRCWEFSPPLTCCPILL